MSTRTRSTIRSMRRHWPASVALLALGISVGGTAYASGVLLPPASVGSVQIKPGAITAPEARGARDHCESRQTWHAAPRRLQGRGAALRPAGSDRTGRRSRREGPHAAPRGRGADRSDRARPGRQDLRALQARRVTLGHRDPARCPATRSCTSTASRWTKPSRRSPSTVRRTRSSSAGVRPRART